MAGLLEQLRARWAQMGGERSLGSTDLGCVLPLPGMGMWPWQVSPHHENALSIAQDHRMRAVV